MSEKKVFNMTCDDNEIQCTPDNATMYLHPEENERYDHIFHLDEQDNDTTIYRHRIPNFIDLMGYMFDNDFAIVEMDEPSEYDIDDYNEKYPFMAGYKGDILPRQREKCEKMAGFVAYLAEQGKL